MGLWRNERRKGTAAPLSAAFFDVDRTLVGGPTLELVFVLHLIRTRELGRESLSGFLREGLRIVLGRRGGLIEANKGYLEGQSARRMEKIAREVVERIAAERLKGLVRERLEEHKARGDRVILLSADLGILVRPLGEILGADRCEAAELETQRGRYTGRLASTQPIGWRKALVMRRVAAEEGLSLEGCHAYADFFTDRHALSLVGHPVAVDPEPALYAYARLRGWEILRTDRGNSG